MWVFLDDTLFLFETYPSVDQIPAFLSALANVSNRLGDTRGSADRLGDTLRDNLPGDIGKLGGAFDGLAHEVLAEMDTSLSISLCKPLPVSLTACSHGLVKTRN
ncbi:hypothetical protein ACV1F1_20920 [Klebsiella pneumoniae]